MLLTTGVSVHQIYTDIAFQAGITGTLVNIFEMESVESYIWGRPCYAPILGRIVIMLIIYHHTNARCFHKDAHSFH